MIEHIDDRHYNLYNFSYVSDADDKLVHRSTYYYNSYRPSIFVNSGNFLIGSYNSFISQWKGVTMSYQDNYYLVYKDNIDIIFNKDKTIMALYYEYESTLFVYSLKNNMIISASKFLLFACYINL